MPRLRETRSMKSSANATSVARRGLKAGQFTDQAQDVIPAMTRRDEQFDLIGEQQQTDAVLVARRRPREQCGQPSQAGVALGRGRPLPKVR